MLAITDFRGPYRWLSNFQQVDVCLDGVVYPTTEHAYQAAKTLDRVKRDEIRRAETPGKAKRLGQLVALRPDWETVRVDIMLDLQRQKFAHGELRAQLLDTQDAELVEGNTWGDRFWGVCDGRGLNWLGRLLMQVRNELRSSTSAPQP